MRLCILGAGAWGTALAIRLGSAHAITLWTRDPAQMTNLVSRGINERYLPGFKLPAGIEVVSTLAPRHLDCDAMICAVPMAALRNVLELLRGCGAPLILACKGLEHGSALLPHQVVQAVLGERPTCVLSGPSFAQEVAAGLPTALTLASADAALARDLARGLHSRRLRLYCSDDVTGVEIAGATKNVMAIAAGISDGLGLGLNARAALISRGLAEIARLGCRLGGRIETYLGLSGAGDLILTCTGDLSRNRTVGVRLAGGQPLARILADLGHVAEGVATAAAVQRLATTLAVEMPITRAVCMVLDEHLAPGQAVELLLERDPKAEF